MIEAVKKDLEEEPTIPIKQPTAFQQKRRWRNFLQRPAVQVKMGIYSFLIGLGFSSATFIFLYYRQLQLMTSILRFTSGKAEVFEMLRLEMLGTLFIIGAIFILFLVTSTAFSVIYTHKFCGPAVAINRHLNAMRDGKWEARCKLRRSDEFQDIADTLNQVLEKLQNR